MRVACGGTFEPFHVGHEALLREAARGATQLFVGITDQRLADRPSRQVSPWPERASRVEAFLRSTGYAGLVTTRALTEPFGPTVTGDYDALAVSPETEATAQAINSQRKRNGLPALAVRVVPHVLGEDRLPISATGIHAGRIDPRGRRLAPVQVAVGSHNAVKVNAVERSFAKMLPCKVKLLGVPVQSGVAEQPVGDATLLGARNRAKAARKAMPDCDYTVGIEAGLIRLPGDDADLEAQACVILDRNGWETHGWGPAFAYPEWVTKRALAGEMVSDILGPVAKDPRIGSTTGAIGYLSEGRLDRTGLTELAVFMAFLPRLRRSLYTEPGKA